MPHLVQMDRRYSKKGLVLIGAESQNSTTEDIQGIVKKNKIKFPITKGATGPIDLEGIPHMVVFDTKGALVFSGASRDAEKAIKKALKGATPAEEKGSSTSNLFDRKELIAERTWTDAEGRELKAALTSLSGNIGIFRRRDGRTFDYDITKLSEEDQNAIAEAAKKE
jgi:hypothetical protein